MFWCACVSVKVVLWFGSGLGVGLDNITITWKKNIGSLSNVLTKIVNQNSECVWVNLCISSAVLLCVNLLNIMLCVFSRGVCGAERGLLLRLLRSAVCWKRVRPQESSRRKIQPDPGLKKPSLNYLCSFCPFPPLFLTDLPFPSLFSWAMGIFCPPPSFHFSIAKKKQEEEEKTKEKAERRDRWQKHFM